MQKKQYTKRTQKLKSEKNGVMISIYNPLEARFMEQLEQNSAVISYQKNVSLSGWETWIGAETFSVSPAAVTTDFLVQYSDGHQEATEIVERKTLGKPAILSDYYRQWHQFSAFVCEIPMVAGASIAGLMKN